MTDNELIAEFMGGQRSKRSPDTVFYFTPDFRGSRFWHIDYIPFDRSWDWLMPVVEKIETPEVNNDVIIRESADVTIFYKNCHIEYMTDDLDYDLHIDGVQGETKIEAVYKAVVEFIKWYNQNK